jgi:dihydroflavonol-4-reductase
MILVTGSTGLLGSYLLAFLAHKGLKIKALKRANSSISLAEKIFTLYGPQGSSLHTSVEWTEGDVTDYYSITEALQGITHVYHCAALVSFNPADANLMMRINAEGTANVMNASIAAGVKKVCHVSSVAALGKGAEGIITEDTWWKTSPKNSSYAISKYSAEREAWRASEEGLNVVIANPSIVLGAGNWKTDSSSFFGTGYKGMKFYAPGVTGFVDARDAAQCIIQLMEGPFSAERFIISGENVPLRELFNKIHDAFGRKRPYIRADKWMTDVILRAEAVRSFVTGQPPLITKDTAKSVHNRIYFSNEKIRKALNFTFKQPEETIEEVCKIFLTEKQKGPI